MSFERELAASRGTRLPADFEQFWQRRAEACRHDAGGIRAEDAGLASPVGAYEELLLAGLDGHPLAARCVRPRSIAGPVPVVFSFQDAGRGPRGWHHLTRWLALGCAVVQPKYRSWYEDVTEGWRRNGGGTDPASRVEGLALVRLVEDAARCMVGVARLPWADSTRLAVYGEGLGAGVALGTMVVASMAGVPVARACLLNPLPADFRTTWERSGCEGVYGGLRRHFRDEDPTGEAAEELFGALDYVDGVNLARYVGADVLLGIGLLDSVALPATQSAVYEALPGRKERVVYPKWGHERVNDFEDKTLGWLRPLLDQQ